MTPTTSSTRKAEQEWGFVDTGNRRNTGREGSSSEDREAHPDKRQTSGQRANFARKFAVAFAAPAPSSSGPGSDGRSSRGACTLSAELLSTATYSRGSTGLRIGIWNMSVKFLKSKMS
ncbi:unnamed protein product [Calypogeia fissa]